MCKPTATILLITGLLLLKLSAPSLAETREYSLVINQEVVHITDKPLKRITINGGIPGPILEFTEGDDAIIHVTNKMKKDSSVHWHGLLLPGEMDGVPYFNGFQGIKPNETFSYRFKIRQHGTYWYHAHSKAQEQDGHYGAIIIHPKDGYTIKTDRDYVVLLSDFHEDAGNNIMSNLKKSSEYYVYIRRTLNDFFVDAKKKGWRKAWNNQKKWSQMRMLPTDITDINNYTFLINGRTTTQNWTGLYHPGEKIRLRFINASAMSFFDVRIPGLKMTAIAADGQPIEPVTVDEFRFGVAETYDMMIEPQNSKTYTITAEPIDRTGFALATLATHQNTSVSTPEPRPRSLLTMADMGMAHNNASINHSHHTEKEFNTGVKGSGWIKAATPKGHKALAYKDLRYRDIQQDQRLPERDIIVRLGGNMERYIWTLNGKKYKDAEPINLTYGERVRMTFINDTMMAHPMHLHGMFAQLENGQPISKLPNKHTVVVAPGDTYSVLITADEVGEWAFHCHLLYHMMAGMMNKVIVAKLDHDQIPTQLYSSKITKHQQPPHASAQHPETEHPETEHPEAEHSIMGHVKPMPTKLTHTKKHVSHEHGQPIQQPKHMNKQHDRTVYHSFNLEAGIGGNSKGTGINDWDLNGWLGTDENKLWLKSEGERMNGNTEQAEFSALYSRNISTFWDIQIGIRHDVQNSLSHGVIGFEGLAPYFFETEAHLFVSEDGDISARLRYENDFFLTAKLIAQLYVEANLFAQNISELSVGAGLANAELGIQTRYNTARGFALYTDLKYEREFGKTLSLTKINGKNNNHIVMTLGITYVF